MFASDGVSCPLLPGASLPANKIVSSILPNSGSMMPGKPTIKRVAPSQYLFHCMLAIPSIGTRLLTSSQAKGIRGTALPAFLDCISTGKVRTVTAQPIPSF